MLNVKAVDITTVKEVLKLLIIVLLYKKLNYTDAHRKKSAKYTSIGYGPCTDFSCILVILSAFRCIPPQLCHSNLDDYTYI